MQQFLMLRHIATATLVLTIIPGAAAAETNTSAPKAPAIAPIIHAAVPSALGCYVESPPGKLKKIDCLSAEQIAKRPPPAPCTGPDGDAACGMQSTVTAAQQQFGINQIPITEAFLQVTLQQYSSSTDSSFGPGAYSLQLNTNYINAPKTKGWVQFTLQDFPTGGGTRFCVWNIDVTNKKYNPVCTPYNPVPLTARARFTVGGFVCGKGCTYVPKPPAIYGWMHWDVLDAQGNVCSTCGSGTVWAVAPDTYALQSNWLQVSGSILGAGNGSEIFFTGNTVNQNVLGATGCPIPLAPGWACDTPQLNNQYADTAGWVTGESNNLYYAPSPNWVTPQVPQSALACSKGFCSLTAYEIYPNQPLANVKSVTMIIGTGNDDARSDTELQAVLPGVTTLCLKPSNNAKADSACKNGGSARDQNLNQDWKNWTTSKQTFDLPAPVPVASLTALQIKLLEHNHGTETDDNWDIQNIAIIGTDTNKNTATLLNVGNPPKGNNCIVRLTGKIPSFSFNLSQANPTGANPSIPPGSCPQKQ